MIIWDILFLEGTIILFKAALGILKIMKKDLMQIDNVEELNEYLEKREFSFHDISEVVYFLLLRRFEFDNALINRLRKTHEKKVMKEMNYYSSNSLTEQKIKFEEDLKTKKLLVGDLSRNSCLGISEKCNVNWPLCIYDKFFKLNLINFLVFRTADNVIVIDDYFYSEIKKGAFNDIQFKINKGADFDKNSKKLNLLNDNNTQKNAAKSELNLTQVYFSNSNLTLKNLHIEGNHGNIQKELINHNSTEDVNLFDHLRYVKHSTPDNKKFNSVLCPDNYRTPTITNFDLNTLSKKENNLDLQKNIDIAFQETDNLLKNNNEIIFVDNNSDESNEDYDGSIFQDNFCLLDIKDEDLIENSDKEEEENNEQINNFKDLSFDNKRNSINKKIKNLVLSEAEEGIMDRKKNFLVDCSSSKNYNEKSEDDSNKRSHSNELKKIKDIRRENEKRITIYRSLLINRGEHYCQIINIIPNTRITSSGLKESKFLSAEINKRKFFIIFMTKYFL